MPAGVGSSVFTVLVTSEPVISASVRVQLGRRVRARRESLGLSLTQLGDRSRLHWTFFGQVECGRSNITLHDLLEVAAALEVDPAQLLKELDMHAEPDLPDASSARD